MAEKQRYYVHEYALNEVIIIDSEENSFAFVDNDNKNLDLLSKRDFIVVSEEKVNNLKGEIEDYNWDYYDKGLVIDPYIHKYFFEDEQREEAGYFSGENEIGDLVAFGKDLQEVKDYIHLNKHKNVIESLYEEKEKNLPIEVMSHLLDENKNLHILAKDAFNQSYTVWTSYYTGNKETSYDNLYHGKYELNSSEGIKELEKRSGKIKTVELEDNNNLEVYVGNKEVYLFNDEQLRGKDGFNEVIESINDAYGDLDPENHLAENNDGYVEIRNDYEGVIILEGGEYYPTKDDFTEAYPIVKETVMNIEMESAKKSPINMEFER